MMFDDASLSTSRFYFVLIQLLRLFEDAARTTMDDMAEWEPTVVRFHAENGGQYTSEHIICTMIEDAKGRYNLLYKRIVMKREQVESLRDSVSPLLP